MEIGVTSQSAVRENMCLGVDLGIATVGWALLRVADDGTPLEIWCDLKGRPTLGTRTWDAPETDKEKTPKNQLRRGARLLRRVTRRRAQRMSAIRNLLVSAGLLKTAGADAARPERLACDPWEARRDGLRDRLPGDKAAAALIHMAKHRGFWSNSKRDAGNAAPDEEAGKVKKALNESRERLSRYEGSHARMILEDPVFSGRRRNRGGDYSRTPDRLAVEREARRIIRTQRQAGSSWATVEFEEAYVEAAFRQRPLQDAYALLANCAFEKSEKRTSLLAPSFEQARFLQRLNNLRVLEGHFERALTDSERAAALQEFGRKKKYSFAALRKVIGLSLSSRFEGILPEEESKRDVATRTKNAAQGTVTIRSVLGEATWTQLSRSPEITDAIAEALTFRESLPSIEGALGELGLSEDILQALVNATRAGLFAEFRGAAKTSSKFLRSIMPGLEAGLVYSAACERAGYNHAASSVRGALNAGIHGVDALRAILGKQGSPLGPEPLFHSKVISSPVARKAVTEGIKQVIAICQEFGIPGRIIVEAARDVGKSLEERTKITDGIERRNKELDCLRATFGELFNRAPSKEELLRFELLREQNHECIYSGHRISPELILDGQMTVQVDHILPWSRFGDDSYNNKTLAFASENQAKKGRTPFEWFASEKSDVDWDEYKARVQALRIKGSKRRNYTLKNADEVAERFRARNLVDTRFAVRTFADALNLLYADSGEGPGQRRRVLTRPGALTDKLRRAWGVQSLKKSETGERLSDDRHHALDALIVAACSEATLQGLTRAFQEAERMGIRREWVPQQIPPPWESFRIDAASAVERVFVSRAERRRARGEAHGATVRSIGAAEDGALVIFERKAVQDLSLKDLERIPNPERNGSTIEVLRRWIEAKKPTADLPRSPKGDVIRKVRLATHKKVGVLVRGGAADRGEMARVDVYRRVDSTLRGQWFMVPVYPHDIATLQVPPSRAARAGDPADWPEMRPEEFVFSIYSMTFLEIQKRDGEVVEGYFRRLDISTGSITISAHQDSSKIERGIGVMSLPKFVKYDVDRLGRRSAVGVEPRTWRGAVCTSQSLLDSV